jgi:hypothetical protein
MKIKNILQSSPILNFNLVERDRWVETQSSLIPVNSSILDVGSGSCHYRKYFTHCDYKTQDFIVHPGNNLFSINLLFSNTKLLN